MGARRHMLLPVLHAIQARMGWITPTALNYACQRLDVPPAEAYGVACFYGLFSVTPRPRRVLHVCDDIACLTRGAEELCHRMEQQLGPPGSPTLNGAATWYRSSCLGLCERAPAALMSVAGEKPCEKVFAPACPDTLGAASRPSKVVRTRNRLTTSTPLSPSPKPRSVTPGV